MKRARLKPGKIWALRFDESRANDVVAKRRDWVLTFCTRREAVEFQALYPDNRRPELIRLEVREI
jgi:hypothetical protein